MNNFFTITKNKIIIFIILTLLFSVVPIFNCKYTTAYREVPQGANSNPLEEEVRSPFFLQFTGGYHQVYSCTNNYLAPVLVVVALVISFLIGSFFDNKQKKR